MIHFEHINILYALITIPIFICIWVIVRHSDKQKLAKFSEKKMFGRLIPDASRRRPFLKFMLIMLGWGFLIITIANPQVGSKMVKGEQLGSEIAICLDISNSMMAEDLQPNRLERSKRMVNNLMQEMPQNKFSLVVFAGSSYIQMPLTSDHSAAKLFLEQIDCSMISSQGTAIGDAIERGMQTFGYGDAEREWERRKSRAIIVISDGENHEDDAESAARKAYEEGILVFTIGMGLPEGVPIPEYNKSGQRVGYKRDKNGNTVTTSLNEQMLSSIAQAGGGIYVRAGNSSSSTRQISESIAGLEKTSQGEALFSEYESQYMYPLCAALLCLMLEILIFERKNKRFNISKMINKKTAVFVISLLTSFAMYAQQIETRKEVRKGNSEYKNKNYEESETHYRKSLGQDSTYYKSHYNIGNALYRQKKYDDAAKHYQKALDEKGLTNMQRSRAYHNLGNSHLQKGLEDKQNGLQHFQNAVDAYKESMKIDPKNEDTRYNLSYAKKMLKQAEQQQQNQEQDKNQDKNQEQQNNDNKQNQQDNKQDQQNKNQQNQDGKRDQDQKSNQDQKREDMKKQDAERLLEAVRNNERNTLKENNKKLEAGKPLRIEKDW